MDKYVTQMIIDKELTRGVIIAIEGIDGAGKSTQAENLYRSLKDRGYKVILLHEPTNSFFGRKIKKSAINGRHDVYEELEYFLEDRREDVNKNIMPALNKKMVIIMDRYYFSTIAYQGAIGIDPDMIKTMNEKLAPKPDLTIILDIPPAIGLSRIRKSRTSKPNLFESKNYLTKVRESFKNINDTSIKIIDGTREINKVSKEILNMTLNILKKIEKKDSKYTIEFGKNK